MIFPNHFSAGERKGVTELRPADDDSCPYGQRQGVHFTEGKHEWHSKVATKDELRIIARELQIEEVVV